MIIGCGINVVIVSSIYFWKTFSMANIYDKSTPVSAAISDKISMEISMGECKKDVTPVH